MSESPIEPFENGGRGPNHGPDGRFLPGCKPGPGSPLAKRAAELKAAILEAVTPEEIHAVMAKLHAMALAGDVLAAKVWLERVLGKADQPVNLSVTQEACFTGVVVRPMELPADD